MDCQGQQKAICKSRHGHLQPYAGCIWIVGGFNVKFQTVFQFLHDLGWFLQIQSHISVKRWCKNLSVSMQCIQAGWFHLWTVVNKHDFNVDLMDHQLQLYNLHEIQLCIHMYNHILEIGQTTFRNLVTGLQEFDIFWLWPRVSQLYFRSLGNIRLR